MYLHELTPEQQSFAEEQHDLVYAFLNANKLCEDEFYDVVIFGYLRAVQKYLIRESLRQQYKFRTIAWRAMQCDLSNHYHAQSRPSRKAMTVSLEDMAYDGANRNPGSDWVLEQLDADCLWEEISISLPPEQADVLRMRADGYTTREIASTRRSPMREIEDLFRSALESVRELCLV